MKQVYVTALPKCDICGKADAHYDGKTRLGPWANMCDGCYGIHGTKASTLTNEFVVGEAPERDRHAEVAAAIEAGDWDALEDAIGDGDIADYL